MFKNFKKLTSLLLAATLVGGLVGCASEPPVAEPQVRELTPLRLGVMSAADSAPILLAQEKGYFNEEGVDLQLEVFTNGATKQSSIQAGELDAAMLSMIQVLNNIKGGLAAKITTTTDGMFPIVLSKDFQEKKDVKVGLMEVSVTNFLADQYLTDYNMEKIFINEMPVRLQMLLDNQLDMAVLPEPLASNAELKGLTKRVYGSPDDFTPNAIVFTDGFIAEHPDAVQGFHDAYNRAVTDILATPDLAKDILITKLELNPEIKDLIVLPTYHQTRIPTEEYLKNVEDWTESLQGSTLDLDYDQVVSKNYETK